MMMQTVQRKRKKNQSGTPNNWQSVMFLAARVTITQLLKKMIK
jgi:hypothetical protein